MGSILSEYHSQVLNIQVKYREFIIRVPFTGTKHKSKVWGVHCQSSIHQVLNKQIEYEEFIIRVSFTRY
jgi:hypothetical protein